MTSYTVRVILAVSAADKAAADTIMQQMGLGPNNLSIGLIRITDLDGQAPRAFGCCIQLTPQQAQALREAFVAAGIEARGARVQLASHDPVEGRAMERLQELLAARGWRLKPAAETGT